MSKALRVRIPALGKDVSILRLETKEIESLFHSLRIDPDEYMSLAEVESDAVDDDSAEDLSFEMSMDSVNVEFYNFGTISVLLTLQRVVKDFDTKIHPMLSQIGDRELSEAVKQMYRECILVNPTLDYVAAQIYGAHEPLDSDLERLISFLPEQLDSSLISHGVRYGITDRILIDDEVEDRMYEVPDGAVELLDEVELSLDLERVRELAAELSSRMIGQRHAIEHITGVARRVAVGFRDPSRPPAVVMCVGPTGVGKTMLAKETSNILFGDKAFGRIDCAQISERHSVSKLLGPPPGYVGYPTKTKEGEDPKKMDPSIIYKETRGLEEGGILLFDEIEKADVDVLDVLLTAFDEGYLKTSVGNYIDLRNTIIILTSNLGARDIAAQKDKRTLGFAPVDGTCSTVGVADIKKMTMDAVKSWMKPELLSRVTAVLPFTDLSKEEMLQVVDLEWERAASWVKDRIESEIVLSDELKSHIADKSVSRGSGARYVGRLVDSYVVDTVAALYVESETAYDYDTVTLDIESGGECDVVVARFGEETFEYKVSMTVGD